MRDHAIRRASFYASLVVVFALFALGSALVSAQEAAPSTPSGPRELPIKHAAGVKLTEQQTRGAGIFIQHCALCHLDKTFGAGGSKYCCVRSLGPRLAGLSKDIGPDEEKGMRDFIMNGGPTYMPAVQVRPDAKRNRRHYCLSENTGIVSESTRGAMRNFRNLTIALPLFALLLTASVGVPRAFSQDAKIKGTVTTVDGKPMEGATVSVRGQGEPYVTTVFTNDHGVYVFPTLGSNTKYSLWAQAQGFQTAKTDAMPGKQVAALQLKPLKDFSKQLTGVEWMNSFPENTPQEKREKQIFVSNCSGCHDNHFALQNRFDADGWSKIITVMSKDSEGTAMNPNAVGQTSMNEYKDELVAFLTKVRGPAPATYALKPLPRPTGEAARVVITEYDVPRPEAPAESLLHNGSDWMEGTPSRWEGRASHDAAVGSDGHVYFSDDRSMTATMSELDPKTGKVTSLAYPYKNGVAPTHGVTSDADGNIFADSMGDFLEFDPKSQQFKDIPRPAGA